MQTSRTAGNIHTPRGKCKAVGAGDIQTSGLSSPRNKALALHPTSHGTNVNSNSLQGLAGHLKILKVCAQSCVMFT